MVSLTMEKKKEISRERIFISEKIKAVELQLFI